MVRIVLGLLLRAVCLCTPPDMTTQNNTTFLEWEVESFMHSWPRDLDMIAAGINNAVSFVDDVCVIEFRARPDIGG